MADEIPPIRPRFEPLFLDWSLPDDRTPEASSPWPLVFVTLDFLTLGLLGFMALVVVGSWDLGAGIVRAVRERKARGLESRCARRLDDA
ncbi:MAG TPA: hypothetical protein VK669_02815 [Candidatus Limnocylindrales bacterium]|nr:hypothetical protein [Candidatus Limnocylindrales bacterium]